MPWGQFAPTICCRIINAMSADALTIVAANCMNLAIQNGNGNRTRRQGQRRQLLPLISHGIVNAHVGHRRMVLLDEAADAIYLPIESNRPNVIQPAPNRSTTTPSVGRRIVL